MFPLKPLIVWRVYKRSWCSGLLEQVQTAASAVLHLWLDPSQHSALLLRSRHSKWCLCRKSFTLIYFPSAFWTNTKACRQRSAPSVHRMTNCTLAWNTCGLNYRCDFDWRCKWLFQMQITVSVCLCKSQTRCTIKTLASGTVILIWSVLERSSV